ncbi:hypothetical protein FHX42_002856 [Saccharopolyspora lacisalsi]|uniref:Uncharacterized protein n=1 Tax=Halosaccharopolyspora lacisalsi TaxID=1000566 RepID=A0A839E1C4_9PSEU|nr:hypothetical protein [Halosaccharopolyspora lacisalsi]MBA8825505.1 hypothetical protein [Halosaccharopolyspora lacisalsi]
MDVEGLGALEENLDRASENLRQVLDAMRDVSEESLASSPNGSSRGVRPVSGR